MHFKAANSQLLNLFRRRLQLTLYSQIMTELKFSGKPFIKGKHVISINSLAKCFHVLSLNERRLSATRSSHVKCSIRAIDGARETRCESRWTSSPRGACLYNFDTQWRCEIPTFVSLLSLPFLVLAINSFELACIVAWHVLVTPAWRRMRWQKTSRQLSRRWWPKSVWWV